MWMPEIDIGELRPDQRNGAHPGHQLVCAVTLIERSGGRSGKDAICGLHPAFADCDPDICADRVPGSCRWAGSEYPRSQAQQCPKGRDGHTVPCP
jgi:hypothetical protein